MAYLRAHLQYHSSVISTTTVAENLRVGTLPPQLILETIESFYRLLFPVSIGEKSQSIDLLRRLIREEGFDPQVIKNIKGHFNWINDDFKFHYWGSRLDKLHELAKNPPPTSSWMSWLDRHTRDRNALVIALVGLFLAALFGMLSFIVGLAQLVISIYAWKSPVSPNC